MIDYPAFYDPARVGTLYEPDIAGAMDAGSRFFKQAASQDRQRVLLWLVDVQVDFVFPAPIGRLPVPGAVDDTRRTVEWLYRNTPHLTHVAASLDTHLPFQIFYPSWWKDAAGHTPAPYTVITAEQVERGEWLPQSDAQWSRDYVRALESVGKKQLMIWPYHCMEGTVGRGLVPALAEAIAYHSAARTAQPTYLVKGTIPQTEFYSVVEPEVKYMDHPDGGVNNRFLGFVSAFDMIYVAGQARSHCVLETMNSMLRHFAPEAVHKVRFLNDCTSSIRGFEEPTEARIKEFEASGVKLVRSVDPID